MLSQTIVPWGKKMAIKHKIKVLLAFNELHCNDKTVTLQNNTISSDTKTDLELDYSVDPPSPRSGINY